MSLTTRRRIWEFVPAMCTGSALFVMNPATPVLQTVLASLLAAAGLSLARSHQC